MDLPNAKVGVVTERDPELYKVRVKFPLGSPDDIVSNWLQVANIKGGYNLPEINEQGLCLFDEDWNRGIYVASVYIDGEAPYTDENILGFKIGSLDIQVNKTTGEAKIKTDENISVETSKNVNLKASKVVLDGNVEISGTIKVTGAATFQNKIDATGIIKSTTDVQTATVKLNTHMHPTAGTGPPSPPTPGT